MTKLIKIDRNGSKHYEDVITCPKCGGLGLIVHHMENGQPSIQWTDGGVCWKCLGAGKIHSKWIERTPEYEAKLAAKRQAKHEAKMAQLKAQADEANAEFFKQQGFNAEGKTFVVLGDTYDIRSELKDLGCKWSGTIGWHTDHQIDGYTMKMFDIDDCYYKDYTGTYKWQNWKSDIAEKIKVANEQLVNPSNYIGTVGEKININCTHWQTSWFEVPSFAGYGMTTMYVHTFKDPDGNMLVWKTNSNSLSELCHGVEVNIKATIKEHSEYKNVKQTVLTRCKVVVI